ncbi:IS30 family transposase [Mycoplasma seminis]|uniref:IS30 family transposase n=1 Tax=Mycoplasma seminis TaxID=512749 RepID=A0ABY9H9Z7_9MOLU|nr:IS30 family transposase [Mycoplasma seminis]WLP85397.1 IS30 family transposase [Mycoplasma seminis]
MDSLNNENINKMHKEINSIREQKITNFNIEKLAIMFKHFETANSLTEIAKLMNISNKILKQNLKLATLNLKAENSYKFCSNCGKRLTTIFKVSHHEWYKYKIENIKNPVEQLRQNTLLKWKDIVRFSKYWSKQHKRVKKLLSKGQQISIDEKKFEPLISVATFLDYYKEQLEDKNAFVPTPQAFYDFMDCDYVHEIDFSIFIIKSKRGISKAHWDKQQNKKKKPKGTQSTKINFGISIHLAPLSIRNREEFGHYEMDTVILNLRAKWCILTLLERKTRMLFGILTRRDAELVKEALITLINHHNLTILSLTIDNGSENVKLNEIKQIPVIYKCDTYSSWQKGSIENAHKKIRNFLPKGKFPRYVNDEYIFQMFIAINDQYREYIDDKTGRKIRLKTSEFFNSFI